MIAWIPKEAQKISGGTGSILSFLVFPWKAQYDSPRDEKERERIDGAKTSPRRGHGDGREGNWLRKQPRNRLRK